MDKRGKVQVTYNCGHTRMVMLFDAEKLTDNQWVTKLEGSDCPACWLKQQPPRFYLRVGGVGVTVSRGYPIRDELKERGYRFTRPIWRKRFTSELERQAEILWISERGFNLEHP